MVIYLTGIYFIDEKKNRYHSWSFKETSFKVLEIITDEENIPLAFFDVQNKKILIKSDENTFDIFSITNCESLLYNEDKFEFVEINFDKKDLIEIFEGMKNQVEFQGITIKPCLIPLVRVRELFWSGIKGFMSIKKNKKIKNLYIS